MTTSTLFDRYYIAFPQYKEHLDAGDKITTSYPERRSSHCRVLEFTADEGHVLLPTRMKNMEIQDCEVDFAQPLDYKEPEKKTSVLGKRERSTLGDEDRKSRPTHDEDSKLFPGEGRRLGGKTTVPAGLMKKLKIPEVATTKKVDGSLKSKQGTAEFKPFSGKAKRLDGEPIVAVAVKDVEHNQSNAGVKMKEEKQQGFKAFTGKSFRAM